MFGAFHRCKVGIDSLIRAEVPVTLNPVFARQTQDRAPAYVDFVAAGFNEVELTDRLMESRHEAMDYLTDRAAMGGEVSPTQADYYYPVTPGTHAGGL